MDYDYSKLKNIRLEHKLTQEELEDKIELGLRTIRDIETGRQTIPSQNSLQKYANVFFEGDLEKLKHYCRTPFAEEKYLLQESLNKGNILPFIVPALSGLLDNSRKSAVSYAVSCLLGAYRASKSTCGLDYLLGTLSRMIHTATLIDSGIEMELLWEDLIGRIKCLTGHDRLLVNDRTEGLEILELLKKARFSNDPEERMCALRRCFFWLHDMLSTLAADSHFYFALSDIGIISFDSMDGDEARRDAFHFCMQCAEMLSMDLSAMEELV